MFMFTDLPLAETWILLSIVILLINYLFHRNWKVLIEWNIPHDPPTLLNLGHTRNILSERSFEYELECKRKYGPIWGCYVLRRPRIVIHDTEILRRVLATEFQSFPDRLEKVPILEGRELSNSIILITGNQWKRVRTTLVPTFSTSKLREMAQIADFCIGNTLTALRKRVKTADGIFSARDVFSRLSLDIICSAAFSTDVNSQEEGKEPSISYHARNFTNIGFHSFRNMLLISFPFLAPLLAERGGRQKHLRYFKDVLGKIIEQRGTNPGQQERIDLLQLMIRSKVSESEIENGARKGMTSVEITGNAVTMLFAGYQTTGSSMIFLSYNLAVHPEIQKRLQAEIDELFDANENINFDNVNELAYLELCINESLRLYTPVPKTLRTAKNEVCLSGLRIPRGCIVTIPIYALCHDPEYWENPMEFVPERMRNLSEIDPMVFQPFGRGPRNCIGSRFALMEIKLAFCKILRNFTFEPTANTPKPPLKLTYGVTLCPKVDYHLRAVPRNLAK